MKSKVVEWVDCEEDVELGKAKREIGGPRSEHSLYHIC
jgi:hypothetical protein